MVRNLWRRLSAAYRKWRTRDCRKGKHRWRTVYGVPLPKNCEPDDPATDLRERPYADFIHEARVRGRENAKVAARRWVSKTGPEPCRPQDATVRVLGCRRCGRMVGTTTARNDFERRFR